MSDSTVNVALPKVEALVLFEFLSRYAGTGKLEILDQAEQITLWSLLSNLEKTLVEPFMPNYSELLDQARGLIRYSKG